MKASARPIRDEDGFLNRGAEVTRAEAFFDAAFAFAITLMVISIDTIPDSAEALTEALKSIPAFAASFLLIVLFWRGHADWSRRYGLNDRRSQRLSLLLVFLVLIFIYPLRMVYAAFFAWVSQGWLPAHFTIHDALDLRLMFVVFALAFGSMGTTMLLLYRHAWSKRSELELDAVELLVTRRTTVRWALLPVFSIASLGCSSLLTAQTTNNWLIAMPGLIFFPLHFIEVGLNWRLKRALHALRPE